MRSTWLSKLMKEMRHATRIVILGIGNTEKGDDSAGVRCAEALAHKLKHPSIKVIIAGEVPENYTGMIRSYNPTHVVIIDACAKGMKPGAVFLVDPSKIANDDVSTHRMPLSLFTMFLEKTVRCKVLIIGIEPQSVDWHEGMSATVAESILHIADNLSTALLATLKPR